MKKIIIIISAIIILIDIFIIIKPDYFVKKENQPEVSIEETSVQTPEPGEEKRIVDYIETDNYANKNLKFFYYIPSSIVNSQNPYPLIVWVPGLSDDGEKSLWQEYYDFAEQNGFAIITPSFQFDEENINKGMSYQFPDVWSGEAFINMLNKAKENGLNYSQLYLSGFSAGAQFVSRFSLYRPDLVKACAIMSSGGKVQPDERVKDIKYFYGVGLKDDDFRIENAKYFTSEAQKLGISVEYKEYDFGHDMNNTEISDILNFFKNTKDN